MDRPRLMLVSGASELEWQIKPQLEEWADVITFDPPGVGASEGEWSIEATVERGLQLLDEAGWDDYVLVSDNWGQIYATGILEARPEPVRALALGHAALSGRTTGERAPLNGSVWDAFNNVVSQGQGSFARFAIPQFTQDGIPEEVAGEIVERVPANVLLAMTEAVRESGYDLVELLRPFDLPLLLGKHEGCLVFTEEGYEDAVAAFPQAQTVSTEKTCCADPAFGDALKRLCEELYPS